MVIKMDKSKKKEIVKMLLKSKEDINEEELMELLFDQPIAVDVDKLDKNNMKFSDKVADKITAIAGSWYFIIGFTSFLIIWILLNVYLYNPADITNIPCGVFKLYKSPFKTNKNPTKGK